MSDIQLEFKAWRERKGLTGVQSQEEVDQFLVERRLPEQVRADCARWQAEHPEIRIGVEPNRTLLQKYLDTFELPATYNNLSEAYAALSKTGNLVLVKVEPPLPEIETRPGQWTNSVFRPWPSDNSRGTIKSSIIGQHDPQASGDEPQIRKRPERMTSLEYAEACRTSKAFRDKENAK
jgi:hypothetical protein